MKYYFLFAVAAKIIIDKSDGWAVAPSGKTAYISSGSRRMKFIMRKPLPIKFLEKLNFTECWEKHCNSGKPCVYKSKYTQKFIDTLKSGIQKSFSDYISVIAAESDSQAKTNRTKRSGLSVIPGILNGVLQIVGLVKQCRQDKKIADLSSISHSNRKSIHLISNAITGIENTILLERKHNLEKFNTLGEAFCVLSDNTKMNFLVQSADKLFTDFRNQAETETFPSSKVKFQTGKNISTQ